MFGGNHESSQCRAMADGMLVGRLAVPAWCNSCIIVRAVQAKWFVPVAPTALSPPCAGMWLMGRHQTENSEGFKPQPGHTCVLCPFFVHRTHRGDW